MTRIIAVVEADGSFNIDFKGYIGTACQIDAKKIREFFETLGMDLSGLKFIPKTPTSTEWIPVSDNQGGV